MDKRSEHESAGLEYAKPEIRDYGELHELTATTVTVGLTDVPLGTPGQPPPVFSPAP